MHNICLNEVVFDAMIDTGSNLSLIRTEVANKLNLRPKPVALELVSADGQRIFCRGTVEIEASITI